MVNCDNFEQEQTSFEVLIKYALDKTKRGNANTESYFPHLRHHLQTCNICQKKALNKLLQKMEIGWRVCWMLRFLSDTPMEYPDIAKALKIDVDTVKKYRANASRAWRVVLKDE